MEVQYTSAPGQSDQEWSVARKSVPHTFPSGGANRNGALSVEVQCTSTPGQSDRTRG